MHIVVTMYKVDVLPYPFFVCVFDQFEQRVNVTSYKDEATATFQLAPRSVTQIWCSLLLNIRSGRLNLVLVRLRVEDKE